MTQKKVFIYTKYTQKSHFVEKESTERERKKGKKAFEMLLQLLLSLCVGNIYTTVCIHRSIGKKGYFDAIFESSLFEVAHII